jgi:hypothetical protein
MVPLSVPFEYALTSWMVVVDAMSGRCDILRDGALVGSTRYDPDLGFGQVPPTLQPLVMTMSEALAPYNDRLRFAMNG